MVLLNHASQRSSNLFKDKSLISVEMGMLCGRGIYGWHSIRGPGIEDFLILTSFSCIILNYSLKLTVRVKYFSK